MIHAKAGYRVIGTAEKTRWLVKVAADQKMQFWLEKICIDFHYQEESKGFKTRSSLNCRKTDRGGAVVRWRN